jgi:serine protease Do/serine protease DegQ
MRKILLALLFAIVTGTVTVFAQNQRREQPSAAPVPVVSESTAEPFPLDANPVDRTNTHQFSSYAPMLERVTPAVVTVATSSVVRVIKNRRGDPMEELMRRLYGLDSPDSGNQAQEPQQGQELRVPSGMGSGVVISTDGFILTNNHVVCNQTGEAADEIVVTLPDGRDFNATIVGRDPQTDVALIKIEADNLAFIPMADSDNLKVGDIVFAVGNPMGLSQTVTMGIVSAVGRSRLGLLGDRGYEDFIQTDASINPGNSGGALVDTQGRLVGINSAILSQTGGSIGIGFAIPTNLARSIAESLVTTGKVERGYLGVTIRNLDPTLAESFGIEEGHGSLVEVVQPDSPADSAGLRRGDVVVTLDGKPIASDNDFRIIVAQKKPGAKIRIGYVRDGRRSEVEVTLGSLSNGSVAGNMLLDGVMVQVVNEELARRLGLESSEGVVVTQIATDSPFSRTLVVGMQILEINDRPISSVAQASKLIRRGAVNRLWVWYRGNSGYIGLRVP